MAKKKPQQKKTKTARVAFALTPAERSELERKAKRAGETVSQYVRRVVTSSRTSRV